VTCLWLNPINPSPRRDGGYDITDYYTVDPRLCSLSDFAELLHQAGNRGIKVIIDLVVNHTSDQHPWFQNACSSPDSPFRDWYVWSDSERRGIRRRLAPMLGGDRRRLELAYSLQFTLRGTPVLRYGEEIGMGDDLSLPGRDAIRTPMQWSAVNGAGFTRCDHPIRPLVCDKQFGYQTVNVAAQRHDPRSLLGWLERMIRTLRESPEVGAGTCLPADEQTSPAVLAHRADGPSGRMLFLHNLDTSPERVHLGKLAGDADNPNQVFGNQEYRQVDGLRELDLDPYGYRWIRLSRNPAG
jgi:glycosidase